MATLEHSIDTSPNLNSARIALSKKKVNYKDCFDLIVVEKRSSGEQLQQLLRIKPSRNSAEIENVSNFVTNYTDLGPLYKDIFFSQNIYSREKYDDLRQVILDIENNIDEVDGIQPCSEVIEQSKELLDILYPNGIIPTKIGASYEGSIIWEFLRNDKYYLIELHNDGDIVYLKRNNEKRVALDLTFESLMSQVIQLLND
jgi:hypothetical protein